MLKTPQSPIPCSRCSVEERLLHDTSKSSTVQYSPIEGISRLRKAQSFIQPSSIQCIPIRYGMVCGKSGQMTVQLDPHCRYTYPQSPWKHAFTIFIRDYVNSEIPSTEGATQVLERDICGISGRHEGIPERPCGVQ
jgi:hypothetical protein